MYLVENIDKELKKLVTHLHLFAHYRLIDYESYEVYDYQNGEFVKNKSYCYEIWQRGKPCQNCTSRYAGVNQCEMFKLEFLDGKLFLIVSYPIQIGSRNFVLELINDVTQSLSVGSINQEGDKIEELINSLNDYVIHDSFTGLHNKKYIIQEIDRKLAQNKKMALALIDLDHFKDINDTYGHVKGDEVILFLADVLKNCLENSHVLASRIGGDEFVIVFEDVNEYDVDIVCFEIHQALKRHSFYKDGKEFRVEISIGVAFSYHGDKSTDLIDRADQMMYQIKREKNSKK